MDSDASFPAAGKRSGLGRERLLAAAREVISEFGVEGLRVRRLAAAAGVSPPLVSYHYPDQATLIASVHRELVLDYFAYREGAARAASGPIEKLRACARAGLPPAVDPALVAPLFELHGLARRNSAHAEAMSGLWHSEHALYLGIIEDGVREQLFTLSRPAADVAGTLLALEDGLALHLVGDNASMSGEWALSTLLHTAALELSCPELEHDGSRR
ncbi:TetR/AcrR family transcriptional regulator [Leucobacter albus]|uniref:TetR/AcrR family transcriptional regulator n=1 Tax=Leucobacter albus TaxID=272210 RepID=A0ABW3TKS9_9MICO